MGVASLPRAEDVFTAEEMEAYARSIEAMIRRGGRARESGIALAVRLAFRGWEDRRWWDAIRGGDAGVGSRA